MRTRNSRSGFSKGCTPAGSACSAPCRPTISRKTYYHPERERTYSLGQTLDLYAWHGRHHAAQIEWLRQHHGW